MAEKLKVGDPLSDDTDLGPLVNASGLKTIDSQVKDSVKEGAELLTGGEQIKSKGYFYKPTILKKCFSKNACSTGRSLWSCCTDNCSR